MELVPRLHVVLKGGPGGWNCGVKKRPDIGMRSNANIIDGKLLGKRFPSGGVNCDRSAAPEEGRSASDRAGLSRSGPANGLSDH